MKNSSKYFKKWKIRFGLMLPHPTFYVKRSLFDKFGYYNYLIGNEYDQLSQDITRSIDNIPQVLTEDEKDKLISEVLTNEITQAIDEKLSKKGEKDGRIKI